MGTDTKIQWTNDTWNPWHGCKKVSPGCQFCYMFRDKARYGQEPTAVLRSKTKFDMPLKLQDGRKIFTCSWSDFFIVEADAWRDEAWDIIRRTPQHTYQILTKRIERVRECLPPDWGDGYPNVWLGVSTEDQDMANLRIPLLLDIPARIRWVSAEPLIGPIDFTLSGLPGWDEDWRYNVLAGVEFTSARNDARSSSPRIDWVVVGGESGNDAGYFTYRHCQLEWIENIIGQCCAAGVPVFVKQLGSSLAGKFQLKDRFGGTAEEWPPELQIREFPG